MPVVTPDRDGVWLLQPKYGWLSGWRATTDGSFPTHRPHGDEFKGASEKRFKGKKMSFISRLVLCMCDAMRRSDSDTVKIQSNRMKGTGVRR